VCYSKPSVYAYLPNFVSIVFGRPLAAKNPIFCNFLTLAFRGVASLQQSEKVERECTTTHLALSNGIKIVPILQRLRGKIDAQISDVYKRGEQTDGQTKISTFLAAPAAGDIRTPPNLAW